MKTFKKTISDPKKIQIGRFYLQFGLIFQMIIFICLFVLVLVDLLQVHRYSSDIVISKEYNHYVLCENCINYNILLVFLICSFFRHYKSNCRTCNTIGFLYN